MSRIRYRATVIYKPDRRNPWIVRRRSCIGEFQFWMGCKTGMGFINDPDNFGAKVIGFKTKEAAQKRANEVNAFEKVLQEMTF